MGKQSNKPMKKVTNQANPKQYKLVKHRPNGKESIDVKYCEDISLEDICERAIKYGEKVGNSYVVNGSNQLLANYLRYLYDLLADMELPNNPTVKYDEHTGETYAIKSSEKGMLLGPYLNSTKFKDTPNVNRIGWLIMRFNWIINNLKDGEYEKGLNSALVAIAEFNNVVLISKEHQLNSKKTDQMIESRKVSGDKLKSQVFKLANEFYRENPKLTNTKLAELIAKKVCRSPDYIRTKILINWAKPTLK